MATKWKLFNSLAAVVQGILEECRCADMIEAAGHRQDLPKSFLSFLLRHSSGNLNLFDSHQPTHSIERGQTHTDRKPEQPYLKGQADVSARWHEPSVRLHGHCTHDRRSSHHLETKSEYLCCRKGSGRAL